MMAKLEIKDIIGTWKLKAIFYKDSQGENKNLYGPDPIGILMYDEKGNMSAQIGSSSKKKQTGKTEKKPEEVTREETPWPFMAYFGTYYQKKQNVLIHKVTGCVNPDWENTEEVRYVTVNKNEMYITTPDTVVNGIKTRIEVFWERSLR